MTNLNLVEALAFSAPIVSALVCMVMMVMNANASVHKHNAQDKMLRLFLALTYFVTSLGWLGMVFYSICPRIFAYYYSVFLLTLMLDQVMIYRFVTIITSTGERRRFNRLHLLPPLLFTTLSVVSDFCIPVELQISLIYDSKSGGDPHIWFRLMYILTTLIFVVYNTIYPLLNLRYIRRYRDFIVNYSSDAYHTSLNWLATIQILILFTVPLPFAGLLMGISTPFFSFFACLGALPYLVNYLILCYNLLNDNYLVIQSEAPEEDRTAKNATLYRKSFERYMREKKPYLDPKLRITDLAKCLKTNRTNLSGFINKEYGMNFCRLINRYRLQELDHLCSLPSSATKAKIKLVLAAGFVNYRSYRRAKSEEDKLATLKVFE